MTDLVKSNRAPASDAKYVIGPYNLTQIQLDNVLNRGVVKAVAAAAVLSQADTGKQILLDMSTGFTLTLPAAEVGLEYDIYIDVGGTDGSAKVTVGSTSDYFYGSVLVLDNADDKHALQTAVKATSAATPTSFDWLLLDGDSNNTGGAVGGVINIKCVTANAWQVTAVLSTSGTPTSIATIYAG